MKKLAEDIRTALKNEAGYSNRDVSVRCQRNYTIHVESKKESVDKSRVKDIALREYHKDGHAWLMVYVDKAWLPMPPLTINDWSRRFAVPEDVATCAGCGTPITVKPDGWEQITASRNLWKVTSITSHCETDKNAYLKMGKNQPAGTYHREGNVCLNWLNNNFRWRKIE